MGENSYGLENKVNIIFLRINLYFSESGFFFFYSVKDQAGLTAGGNPELGSHK